VALKEPDDFLERHYWTNAMMHGASSASGLRNRAEEARTCCEPVLGAQIDIIQPKVIIANGMSACRSLHALGLLRKKWDEFRGVFPKRVYSERRTSPSGGSVTVFASYHTSIGSVNRNVSPIYSTDTEASLREALAQTSQTDELKAFLSLYTPDSVEGKGMRVLLLHWLRIGKAVREAYAG
jgi:uracil-DNA glycosylase